MALVADVVMTGGPCAGKTTGMSYLSQWLMERGFRVLVIPEVATMYITGGVSDLARLAGQDRTAYRGVEEMILLTQRDLRARYRQLAERVFAREKVVILEDRAEGDVGAYLDPEEIEAIMDRHGLVWAQVRDTPDAVIHLVTAADGAAEYYTQENNTARRESLEEAVDADRRTQSAWVGHPHLRVVDNSTDFEGKLARVVQEIARVVGVPVPLEIERKFLLSGEPDLEMLSRIGAQKIEIDQIYLLAPSGEERRIRRRRQSGGATYYLTRKTPVKPGVRHETESRISGHEWLEHKSQRDPKRHPVRKERWCFLYEGQYFELDNILEPASRACWLLEIELSEEGRKVRLPDFLPPLVEVTGDDRYSNADIARG